MLAFVDPRDKAPLRLEGDQYRNPVTGAVVATVRLGIPRFVAPEENYAESFGYQWKKWHSIRSDARNPGHNLRQLILDRTHFAEFDIAGKTLLECGMGGGDDTEVLLGLPFAEIHSFDLSSAVERAASYLRDERLRIFQASIYDIPYPDASFDVVYCHRVLQHTPDLVAGEGRITTQVLQITGGSDLSEKFDITPIHDELKAGMIVSIDPENPGRLVTSSTAYDRTVAGIISGAGGVKPGMLMGQAGTAADGKHPVALTGRVYCWMDADQGAIRPGDLLTTSSTPGHGMKVTDHAQAQGATIGKAMSSLEKGKGLVLVLVSLQ